MGARNVLLLLAALAAGSAHRARAQCQCAACAPTNWTPLSASATAAQATGRGPGPKSVGIVVSHCRFRIRWLASVRAELEACGYAVRTPIHVYSKCGKADVGAPPGAVVVRLPNVGRCDHTYAHHLAELVVRERDDAVVRDADVLLFLKDSFLSGSSPEFKRLRMGICSMVRIAWLRGFGCGRRAMPSQSALIGSGGPRGLGAEQQLAESDACSTTGLRSDYHQSSILAQFELSGYAKTHDQRRGARQRVGFTATHRPLRAWIASVGAELAARFSSNASLAGAPLETLRRVLARPLQPVCFGGSFAAATRSIRSLPATLWSVLRAALSRGDNIEESHFMERSWAALLAEVPADGEVLDNLYRAAGAIVQLEDGRYWMRGSLDGCSCRRGGDRRAD